MKYYSVLSGMNYRAEYRCYKNMIYRCTTPSYIRYKDYGGRGITVCDRWMLGFNYFIEDMGARPSDKHSLDRIDNNGNYSPNNCRWTIVIVQMNNKRQTNFYPDDIIDLVKSELEKGTPVKLISETFKMSKGAVNHYRYKMQGINYKKGVK